MEILSYLEFKMNILLTKSKVDTFRCNNIISTIRSLKSLYTLKKNYNTDVSFKDYRIHKTSVLQNCIIKIYPGKIFQIFVLHIIYIIVHTFAINNIVFDS